MGLANSVKSSGEVYNPLMELGMKGKGNNKRNVLERDSGHLRGIIKMNFTYRKALKFMRIWQRLSDDALDFVFAERIVCVFECGDDVDFR